MMPAGSRSCGALALHGPGSMGCLTAALVHAGAADRSPVVLDRVRGGRDVPLLDDVTALDDFTLTPFSSRVSGRLRPEYGRGGTRLAPGLSVLTVSTTAWVVEWLLFNSSIHFLERPSRYLPRAMSLLMLVVYVIRAFINSLSALSFLF